MDFRQITIVIVLYKRSLEESETIRTLLEFLDTKNDLLVFDNSPEGYYENDTFDFRNLNVHYFHDSTNPGLSKAYNRALAESNKVGSKWLLLLDQDTTLTKEYIDEIIDLDDSSFDKNTVAIMPNVLSLDKKYRITPCKLGLGGITKKVELKSGVITTKITGINSGTLLRTEYLNKINGFSISYSLDMLDHWYFRKIFKDKKSVFLLKATIYQDLSVHGNFEKSFSLPRYLQMLKAETFFMEEEGFGSLFFYHIRLIFRSIKQIKYKNKNYFFATLKQIIKLQ